MSGSNKQKGITIIECIIALFLTTVAVLTLMNMQPLAWQGAGKSDYLGRAVGILQRELESNELMIMAGQAPPNGQTCSDKDGNVVACNDKSALFAIEVTTSKPSTIPPNTTLLNVKVNWPGNKRGITSSLIVSPQGF
jgi:Tfp pilus assembly protein PilV